MIENVNKMIKIAASYGLILGSIMIVAQTVSSLIGIPFLLIAVYIGGIIYTTVVYRDKYLDGIISYGKSLLFGVLVSGFTFIIIGVFLYAMISFNQDEFREVFNNVLENMKTQGYPVSDIRENLLFNPAFLLISYLLTGLFTGFIVSLITSIFTKKN
jgi:hypothetical protein